MDNINNNDATPQSWDEVKTNLLAFINEGDMIHRNATAESWPGLRDAFLIRHDLLDAMGDMEFKPRTDAPKSTKPELTVH